MTSETALGVAAEPFATPSNNLALALEANEQLRVLFKSKSHRGDPCRHLCGAVTPAEMGEASCEEHDRPQTLLPIVDCKVDMLDDPGVPLTPLPHRRDAGLASVAITLTVCGDAPVRLPELLDLFAREEREDGMQRTFEIVALICGGAARASELNDVVQLRRRRARQRVDRLGQAHSRGRPQHAPVPNHLPSLPRRHEQRAALL